jgi:hypothetical protein
MIRAPDWHALLVKPPLPGFKTPMKAGPETMLCH